MYIFQADHHSHSDHNDHHDQLRGIKLPHTPLVPTPITPTNLITLITLTTSTQKKNSKFCKKPSQLRCMDWNDNLQNGCLEQKISCFARNDPQLLLVSTF